MASSGRVRLPVFLRIGTSGEYQVGDISVAIKAAGDHWVVDSPTPLQIRESLTRALIDAFDFVVDAEILDETEEVITGTVCGGQDAIVRFVTEQLGFELTGWQRTYLTRAFQECPDCHHWVHSVHWLGVGSTPCPHCACTG